MTLSRTLMILVPLTIALLTTGCRSRDTRITRMVEQQTKMNTEMVRLNREVAQGLTKITQENAEFRNEALIVQKQLQAQRAELIAKQDELAEERRRFAQHDPLVAKAVTHVGLVLACLLPLGLCWYLLRQPIDQQLDPAVNQLLLDDLVADRPVLVSPAAGSAPRLVMQAEMQTDQ